MKPFLFFVEEAISLLKLDPLVSYGLIEVSLVLRASEPL
jgi:hypothetical protein